MRITYWLDKKGQIIPEIVGSSIRENNYKAHNKIVYILSKSQPDQKSSKYYSQLIDRQHSLTIRFKKNNQQDSFSILNKRKKKDQKEFNINDSLSPPIYKGCKSLDVKYSKKSFKFHKKCLKENITHFVLTTFNKKVIQSVSSDLIENYNLNNKNIKTFVYFKFDQNGDVKDIKAIGLHPKLEKEAILVARSIPKVIPGMKNGKNVGVKYSLPITFSTSKY